MTSTATTNTKAKKILIIEDEGDMCLLLSIILTEKGTTLEHVKSISAAQEFLQKDQPSVVILDNKLPDGYGIDFISSIKKNSPSTKVIMISALGASKDVALNNGADIFLEKPFTKEVLCKSVHELIV